jgi:SH3-like domain-containing protein
MTRTSGRTLNLLWIVTAVVIVLLGVLTWRLAMRAEGQALLQQIVYLEGRQTSVSLYEEPDHDADVVAVVARGSRVQVVEIWNGATGSWYRVERGQVTSGWVPAGQVSVDRP